MNKLIKRRSIRLPFKVSLSPPVVGKDAIFLSDERRSIIKLDRDSLTPVWEVPADHFDVGLGLDDRLIVRSTRYFQIRALDSESGEIRWTIPAHLGNFHPWRTSFLTGVDEYRQLRLVDSRTGATMREFSLTGQTPQVLAVCGDILLYADSEDHAPTDPISAIDLHTGDLLWQRNLLQEMASQATTQERHPHILFESSSLPDRVLAIVGSNLFQYGVTEPSLHWHAPVKIPFQGNLIQNARVLGFEEGRLVCIDEHTGRLLYAVLYPEFKLRFSMWPGRPYRDLAVFASATGAGLLALFRIEDGRLVAAYESKWGMTGFEIADDRFLIVVGDAGRLHVVTERAHQGGTS